MSSGKSGDGNGDRIPIKDPQVKLFMEAIQGQFRTFNNLVQDMREELQEINDAEPYGNKFHELYDKFWKRSKI
ncbi:hypothetical protein JCGZ_18226 [Jatropha curcas]|uniref:Uncharacterized protein n=1 Tax=Jatropha curcas TaxID=180498 RepID=A0A067LAR7_JATCU|nr:hypothetical protein JCGZ_18226 [Jatropha curcas]